MPIARPRILPSLVLLVMATVPSRADVVTDATEFVRHEAINLMEIMTLPAGPERGEAFVAWVGGTVDLGHIARKALGRYIGTATDEQLASYTDAFRSYIEETYEKRLDFFAGYAFEVQRSRTLGAEDVVVRTSVSAPDGRRYVVDFRVGFDGGSGYRVTDIAIEGLSMLKTLRDEFASVIRRDGIEGLTALLVSNAAGAAR